MCALSATTVGTRSLSATAVALLSAPEVDVTTETDDHGPDQSLDPQQAGRLGELDVLHQGVPDELDEDQQRVGLDRRELPTAQPVREERDRVEHRGAVHPDPHDVGDELPQVGRL